VCRPRRAASAEHWARFLAAKRPYVTRDTLVGYEAQGRKRLLPAFGPRELASLDRADVRVACRHG